MIRKSVGLSLRIILTNILQDINWIREHLKLIVEMNNPLSLIKQTRQRYDKELEKVVTEVQVQVGKAPKAWVPVETLEALLNLNPNVNQND
jgi:regulator of replication initiation timing